MNDVTITMTLFYILGTLMVIAAALLILVAKKER